MHGAAGATTSSFSIYTCQSGPVRLHEFQRASVLLKATECGLHDGYAGSCAGLRCCPALVKVPQLLQLLVQLPLGCILQDEVNLLLQGMTTYMSQDVPD